MTQHIDERDKTSLYGAVYFVVGRGTEGGSSSFRLSVAGITVGQSDPAWGKPNRVAANSGYSIGSIQVDLGQRGTWALGETSGRPLRAGERTYVDAIIQESRAYARTHGLPYAQNVESLRADLLSHGNGQGKRSTIRFIDTGTRDSINAWASSAPGKQWIHQNIDYPQVKNATNTALAIMAQHGGHIPQDRRFETICLLAKTANQFPAKLENFSAVLKRGGGYDDLSAEASSIKSRYGYFDGGKAAAFAERYEAVFQNPAHQQALLRAHRKVAGQDFNPSTEAGDADIQSALGAVGRRGGGTRSPMDDGVLRQGERGPEVRALQQKLVALGMEDASGNPLVPDDSFGGRTKQAVERFQRESGLPPTGVADDATLRALNARIDPVQGFRETSERLSQYAQLVAGDDRPTIRIVDGMPDYLRVERPAVAGRLKSDVDQPAAFDDFRFNPGDHGVGVEVLQRRLGALEYPGRDQKPLVADSDFGQNTQHAVRLFQEAHGLAPTGDADLNTLRAIEMAFARGEKYAPATEHSELAVEVAAPDGTVRNLRASVSEQADEIRPHSGQAVLVMSGAKRNGRAEDGLPQDGEAEVTRPLTPVMTESGHPAHLLFLQAQSAMSKVETAPGMGLTQHEQATLSASVVSEALSAKGWNFSDVDHVVLGNRIDPQTGRLETLFVVQGDLDSPAHRRISINVEQALSQSIEQSSAVAQSVQLARQEAMTQEQVRAEAMDTDGPRGPFMRIGGRTMGTPSSPGDGGGDGGGGDG
jgi:peptidoglycan hydrolase-like protein with peptidoglycan-binding domain